MYCTYINISLVNFFFSCVKMNHINAMLFQDFHLKEFLVLDQFWLSECVFQISFCFVSCQNASWNIDEFMMFYCLNVVDKLSSGEISFVTRHYDVIILYACHRN